LIDQLLPQVLTSTEMDWESYFADFCHEHGGSPMLWSDEVRGDWLIFGDGWSYSLASHEGPERPPPDDLAQRCKLLRFYWRRRRHAVRQEAERIKDDLQGLEALRAKHSRPLKTRTTWWDADARAWRVDKNQEVDLDAMRKRLEWLENDLLACDNKLLAVELEAKGKGREVRVS
jgi:hypothetical protein